MPAPRLMPKKSSRKLRPGAGRRRRERPLCPVPAEVVTLFDKAGEAFGGVDVIVNNAGIMQTGFVNVADTDDALFDRLFAINVSGTFNTLLLAAKRLRQGGRIVNFPQASSGSRCRLRALRRHEVGRSKR